MYTVDELERELNDSIFPLDRYKPIEKLGHGMSGRAFLCFDRFLEEEVVVKTLNTVDLEQLIEFQRDASRLCRLRSRSLAQMVDFGATASGIAYVVTEYQPGTTLFKYIHESNVANGSIACSAMMPELAFRVFIPVAEALAAMHSSGVLHRDVRSSNIQIRNLEMADSAVYLIDAGTGRLKYSNQQATTFEGRTFYGDPSYMAPEQVTAQHYDVRSEVFVLGCTFFEALTGRTPFVGSESVSSLVRRSPPSLTQVSEGLSYSHRLEAFVAKCLAKDPNTRYKSMQEVVYALKEMAKMRVSVEYVSPKPDHQSEPTDMLAAHSWNPNLASPKPADLKSSGPKVNLKAEGAPSVRLIDPDSKAVSSNAPVVVDQSAAPQPGTTSGARSSSTNKRKSSTQNQSKQQIASQAHNQSAKSGVQQPDQLAPADIGIAAKTAYLANQLLTWCRQGDSKHKIVVAISVATALICSWLTYSYVSYLTAPREEIPGRIFAYVPATTTAPGLIELGTNADTNYSTLVPIIIENPAQNLPAPTDTQAPDPWSNDLHEVTTTDGGSFDLGNLPSTHAGAERPIESDIRLGEVWQFECRKQNGKQYLETIQFGQAQASHNDLKEIHLTISDMYHSIIRAGLDSNHADEWIDEEWAGYGFRTDAPLSPPRVRIDKPRLFPAQDLKLLGFENGECTMMMKAPDWMSISKYLTIKLRLEGTSKWRVISITRCSERDWERR